MIEHSLVTFDDDTVTKEFDLSTEEGRSLRHAEVLFAERADGAGLAPEVLEVGADVIVTRRGVPLVDSLSRDRRENAAARDAVLEAIHLLHSLGIAHRDLCARNLLATPTGVQFVDWEFACEADPTREPYDLWGPGRSGVSLPAPHAERGRGVWWTSDDPLALWRWLGGVA